MPLAHPQYDKTRDSQALEVSIHIGLAFLLAAFCLFILRPFVLLIAWGIIIAVASYPVFLKLQSALGRTRRITGCAVHHDFAGDYDHSGGVAGAEPGG